MELQFCIQDPTYTGTTYLYEAILAAAVHAARWRGVYAFASRDGVNHLIDDPVVHEFLHAGGEIDLLVGIDAVTNRPTLERLRELEHRNGRFRPRVFWNESSGLFHPKISDFAYEDGRRTLIVGSGNLTPGGLMNNFEGYTIVSVDRAEELDVSALDEFMTRHAAEIRLIDDEALERAARNLVRAIQGARRAGGIVVRRRRPPRAGVVPRPAPAVGFDRILIAQVPAAGGRWAQVHFNTDVVRTYFRIADHTTQRAYLTHVAADGSRADVEVRPCVFSETNKNHKIEIGAARGQAYPAGAPPVLVFRERQLRTFDYMLLMPDENGYAPLIDLTRRLPTLGRGFPRVITDMNTLAASWADCPLLTSQDADEQEV
jgi:hypothetical protein